MLAGIIAEYYLLLERGRAHNPSAQILDALARALQLDAKATRYLHDLAASKGGDTPEVEAAAHGLAEGRAAWAYSVNSLFDLARGQCRHEDMVNLRDHHRGRFRFCCRSDRVHSSSFQVVGASVQISCALGDSGHVWGEAPTDNNENTGQCCN